MSLWPRTAPPTVAFEHAWQPDRPMRTGLPERKPAAVGQD